VYRQRLGRDTRLVLFTPNWICDEKLYPSYKRLLLSKKPSGTRFASCRDWLLKRLPPPTEEEAQRACELYTFSGAGSLNMSAKMAAAARLSGARLLDATAQTLGRCDATDDARHYPRLVPMQAHALEQLL
jgi:hypothetical protein